MQIKIIKLTKRYFQNQFKKIIHFFFFLLYGKIRKCLSAEFVDKILIKEVIKDNTKYKLYIVSNARLYTNTIDDSAVIINNKIIDGPSYQLRSEKNDNLSPRNNSPAINNIIFNIGTPRFKKKINGSVISLLSGGGANNNYFHWLYDVLPRLSFVENNNELKKNSNNFLLVPNYNLKFQKESLKHLNYEKNQIISSRNYRHIEPQKLFVTDHPYNITGDTKVDHEKIPAWISSWLKEKFLTRTDIKNKYNKIYIDRDDVDPKRTSNRRIINEDDLRIFLKNNGFKFIRLNNLSFLKQIEIFNNAEVILGLHGAGFANLSFCKPKTKVIELRTKQTGKILENLALNNDLYFKGLEFEPKKFSDKHMGLIEVSINDLKNFL